LITIEREQLQVSVRAETSTDQTVWVELVFELREPDGLGWLVHASDFSCCVEGTDELARSYDLENWESAIKSGIIFVARRANRMPPSPVRLREINGRLGAGDIGGIARAAEAGFAELLNIPLPHTPEDWNIRVTRRMTDRI